MRNKLYLLFFILFFIFSCKKSGDETGSNKTGEDVTFTFNVGTEVKSLDPHKISGVPENKIFLSLFATLLTVDPRTSEGIPGIATSYERDETGKIYTFKIRENAVWSDGVPITAHTVEDSWYRIVNPETGSPYASTIVSMIKGVSEYLETGDKTNVKFKALDDYTFQFETIGITPYVVNMLHHYAFSIVPVHAVEEHGDDWIAPENIVTSGPFSLVEYRPNDRIIMKKSESFYDKDKVGIDNLIALIIKDENTAYNMFLNGEIDYIYNGVPTDRIEEATLRDDSSIATIFATYMSIPNMNRAPLNDARVRKALALAMDKESLIKNILKLNQVPALGVVPPIPNKETLIDSRPIEEKVAEARALLAEAGYPNGEGFPKTQYLYNTSSNIKMISEFIQEEWRKNLNIEVELVNQEWAIFLEAIQNHNFQISRRAWVGDYLDPTSFLKLFQSKDTNNSSGYNNPEFDRLLLSADQEVDVNKRMSILLDAEKMLVEDGAVFPLYYYTQLAMIDQNKWGGYYESEPLNMNAIF